MIKEAWRVGFIRGMAFALGLGSTALVAAAVTGTFHTFNSGDLLSASQINTNFSTLKTAIESVDPQMSTSETATHKKWLDGKTIYRKVINFGTLPNATTKSVPHGLSGTFQILQAGGIAINSSNAAYPIPFATNGSLADVITLQTDAADIIIKTGADRTNFTTCYVVIEYIKN